MSHGASQQDGRAGDGRQVGAAFGCADERLQGRCHGTRGAEVDVNGGRAMRIHRDTGRVQAVDHDRARLRHVA